MEENSVKASKDVIFETFSLMAGKIFTVPAAASNAALAVGLKPADKSCKVTNFVFLTSEMRIEPNLLFMLVEF